MLVLIPPTIITLLVFEYFRRALLKRRQRPLPPGPPSKFIIGNLNDLPGKDELPHVHFAKHKDLYGPISSLTIFGINIIIVNDANIANELLNKHSVQTSGRPHGEFACEMVNLKQFMSLTPDNAFFRDQRKAMHREIGTKAGVSKSYHLQEVEVARFLLRVLKQPEGLVGHMRTEAGAMILKLAYGYTVEPHGTDPLVELAELVVSRFFFAMMPGAWFVDILPFLKHLPDWFPGTGFKQTAKEWRAAADAFATKPFEFVKRNIASGEYNPSYTSSLLLSKDARRDARQGRIIKWSAAAMYAGGADTTVASMECFFLAMVLYPEVQRKAQEELDRVVGDRLPRFDDRANLPYIGALVKEVLRWYPVAVIGIPHVATEDDVCGEYRIPKGAQIISNIWAIMHDPNLYADPKTFNPDRFLAHDNHVPEQDPSAFAFGFGRRICPGRVLADANLYLNIASFLAVYKIGPAIRDGKPVPVTAEFVPNLISHPTPFEFTVEPRSPAHEQRIRELEVKYPWEESHAKEL
ncbi:cytochrome P450 [Aspergillus unguis]